MTDTPTPPTVVGSDPIGVTLSKVATFAGQALTALAGQLAAAQSQLATVTAARDAALADASAKAAAIAQLQATISTQAAALSQAGAQVTAQATVIAEQNTEIAQLEAQVAAAGAHTLDNTTIDSGTPIGQITGFMARDAALDARIAALETLS